jgi:hypothetical protein
MNISLLFNNFISGELSPLLAARTDTAPYNTGCRVLENFIPLETGGVRKRPGTWFCGYTQNRGPARLADFPLSDGSCMVAEFTPNLIRLWKDDFTVETDASLVTPYTAGQIAGIKYAVSKDSLWLVHPLHAPKRVYRDSGGSWHIQTPSFTGPADFAAAGNCPSCIAFDSGRLFLAASVNQPNTVWGSRAPDAATGEDRYTDFTLETTEGAGPLPGDGICTEENDMYGSRLKWLAGSRMLLAATDRATWADTGDIPTPSTFDMNIVEYTGSSGVQGRGSKDVLVYAGRGGKSLRAMVFSSAQEAGGYMDIEVSTIAGHTLTGGIRDIAIQDFPFPVVWIVTEDGGLVSCTLNVRGGVIAFARHPMYSGAGEAAHVESVAVTPGAAGDVLWLAVERGGERYVERLCTGSPVGEDYSESHYADCGLRQEYPDGTLTLTGLDHLAGKEVAAFADGAPLSGSMTVGPDGTVTLENPVRIIHIGIPYVSALSPTCPEIPANGTSIGKNRRIEKTALRLYVSFGGKAGTALDKLEKIGYMRFGKYVLGSAPEPFTGDQEIRLSGRLDPAGNLFIVHDEPVPFNLLALAERVAVVEA